MADPGKTILVINGEIENRSKNGNKIERNIVGSIFNIVIYSVLDRPRAEPIRENL